MRSSGYSDARWNWRGFLVFYGTSVRDFGAGYRCHGEKLVGRRRRCCGSLLKDMADHALVEKEHFAVGARWLRGESVIASAERGSLDYDFM